MENTPVNAAHAFANAAEELEEKEQWGKAMEAHFRAAEQFALAMNYTSDPEAIRTLKLLYSNHTRQGNDVKRRLTKQQSPNPLPPHRTKRPSSSKSSKTNANNTQVKHSSEQRIQQIQSKQDSTSSKPTTHPSSLEVQTTPGSSDRLSSDHLKTDNNASLGFANGSTSSSRNLVLSDSATSMGVSRTNTMTSSTTPSVMDGSSDSEKTIEESYMMLKGNDFTDDDDSDPFNKFWDIVEGLVQKISNPVAFATVPLNDADSRTTFDPKTIQSPLPFRYNAVNENIVDDSKAEELNSAMMESFCIIPKNQKTNSGLRTLELPQASSSSKKNSTTKTLEEYSIENKQLKAIIDNISKRMLTYEKAAEENNMLKSSILQFKNDVQKQAKRIKVSQEILRSSSIVKQISPESSTVGNAYLQRRIKELEEENRILKSKQQDIIDNAYLQKRIKELEEESRALKSERDKQRELATKYKDRWEKIKESAKKKRVNKQVEASSSPLNEDSSSSKPNLATTSYQQSEYNQNTSSPASPTFSKSQLAPPTSPTTITVTTKVNAASTQSLQQSPSSPGTILPFALQKPQQRPGVGGILDAPSNSKNNAFSTPQRHSAPPTTTILHATSTGPNKLNLDRSVSTESIEEALSSQLAFLPHPQHDKQISGESIPTISSVTNSVRRESAPAIHNSSFNSPD